MSALDLFHVYRKRAVVVGLGASGVAAARLLAKHGAKVVATDSKSEVSPEAQALAKEGIELVLGGHAKAELPRAELIVLSPGVPRFPELVAAEKNRVRIWSEIELAWRAALHGRDPDAEGGPRVIAIGGTNGKSTVTTLIGEILKADDRNVFVGGNLGDPLAAQADERFDDIVLEVSSFQMERVDLFRPDVAVLLNVTPDHLDRYDSMEDYAFAKGNMFLRQGRGCVAVVPEEDAVCEAQARRGDARIRTFGPGGDVDVTPNRIGASFLKEDGNKLKVDFDRNRIALQGGHNALNVAAALAAVSHLLVDPDVVRTVLAHFTGLPHRMALAGEHGGVRFYDDSKGTNVGASVTAVRGITEPKVVLIAGGRDKGGSYGPLVEALKEKGRAVVVIGEAADAIQGAIGDAVPVKRAVSMEEAVTLAASLAQKGDAVLLSPACSSFDMFKDYKHRGDAFVAAVKSLGGK